MNAHRDNLHVFSDNLEDGEGQTNIASFYERPLQAFLAWISVSSSVVLGSVTSHRYTLVQK